MSRALHLTAPAKLNLGLRVVGRRGDGYHLLETVMHPLSLHDDLWMEAAAGGFELEVMASSERARAPDGPGNLVVRGMRAVAELSGYEGGLRCRLHKRIPTGAGLGGGSSDAAAALRLSRALIGGDLSEEDIRRAARSLGADVPFFLAGGTRLARGIGDELEPWSVEPRVFLLVVPPFECPTKDVYKTLAAELNLAPGQASIESASGPRFGACDREVRGPLVNDLEAAAERVRPELGSLRQRIVDLGFPGVSMSGSGSTLFLCFGDLGAAEGAAKRLRVLAAGGVDLLLATSGDEFLSPPEPCRWPGRPEGRP
ncbi:MAG: 4-(cytidine 5'-diphospho)-2-C-methyl-D-erythritol kinase [Planctomycetota bacterium]